MSFQKNEELILQELKNVLDAIPQEQIDQATALIRESDKIFLHALGRAGFAGKSFLMRLMHMGREVYVVGETNTPNFGPGDLLIICSGSGETGQFVKIAEKAKGFGGKVMVFTGTPGSTLASMADAAIVLRSPSKNQAESSASSVQPMASLFEQSILISGDAIILGLMGSGVQNGEMFMRHSNLE